jgi:hypothetical protein
LDERLGFGELIRRRFCVYWLVARKGNWKFWLKCSLAALWLVCLYRAITQSIVHDEAFTYELYVAAPLSRMFSYFDANHHFLNTVLMRLSVALFGVSEWSVRLPALAAACLYFAAVYQIGVKMFRTAAVSLLAVALLTLNPFVLDFMVAARGYGMALALFTYALALLLSCARGNHHGFPRRESLVQAGIALGLAIAANLVFAVPVVVVVAISVLLLRPERSVPTPDVDATPVLKKKRKGKPAAAQRKRIPNPVYRYLVAPLAAVVFLLFLVAPFDAASSSNFYVGAPSVAESLRGLASASLVYGSFLRATRFMNLSIDGLAFLIAPVILIGALALGIRRRDALLLLTAGAGVGSAIILFLAHALVGVPYPNDRTGIYFLVLVPLCIPCLAESVVPHGALRRIPISLFCGLGMALVLDFALQFNVRSFLTWEYDADTREIVDRLAQAASQQQPNSVRVGASWQLEPSLNFYRNKERLMWMRPVERGSLVPGANFYVIMAGDRPTISALGLKPLYRWPRSGSVLAVPVPPRVLVQPEMENRPSP